MHEYQLVRSKRKTLSIQITREGQVVVRAPLFSTERQIREFVENHAEWIDEKLAEATRDDRISAQEFSPAQINVYKPISRR